MRLRITGLLIISLSVSGVLFGSAPDSSGIFIPDKKVEQLAREFDRIYFPLFIQSLIDIKSNNPELIRQFYITEDNEDMDDFSDQSLFTHHENPVKLVYTIKKYADKGYVISFPIPWSDLAKQDPSWNLWFHSLTWLSPYIVAKDPDSVFAAFQFINDWILSHTSYPNSIEKYAFSDHSSAIRMDILLQAYFKNKDPLYSVSGFNNLIRLSLLSHIFYLISLDNYASWHNHGIITDQYLIKVLSEMPEFSMQDQFLNLAFNRIFEQFRYCFTSEGVHKEHSPCYHEFVNNMLVAMIDKAASIDFPVPPDIAELKIRTDDYKGYTEELAYFANIGDCNRPKPEEYQSKVSGLPSRVFPASGWAYFSDSQNEISLIAQADFFSFAHYQQDETSFVLQAHGHDLIIDPGLFSYDGSSPYSTYMRSPFAHNLLIVDNKTFLKDLKMTGMSGITRYYINTKRNQHDGIIEMTHPYYKWLNVEIYRQLAFTGRGLVIVNDIVKADSAHEYSQLYHLAPGALVHEKKGVLTISWPDHPYCLEFTSNADEYEIAEGGGNPLQGWYFPEFNMAWPSKVLILKKKGKGIIIETKIKIYAAHEIARKPGKEEKDADLLFRKLESLERNQLTHCPVPEKWRPARK